MAKEPTSIETWKKALRRYSPYLNDIPKDPRTPPQNFVIHSRSSLKNVLDQILSEEKDKNGAYKGRLGLYKAEIEELKKKWKRLSANNPFETDAPPPLIGKTISLLG